MGRGGLCHLPLTPHSTFNSYPEYVLVFSFIIFALSYLLQKCEITFKILLCGVGACRLNPDIIKVSADIGWKPLVQTVPAPFRIVTQENPLAIPVENFKLEIRKAAYRVDLKNIINPVVVGTEGIGYKDAITATCTRSYGNSI